MSKTFYMRSLNNPELVCAATIIPAKDEKRPYWVNYCKITYSDDGEKAYVRTPSAWIAGCVGRDIVAWWGNNQFGEPMADMISKGSEAYRGLEICDEYGDPI